MYRAFIVDDDKYAIDAVYMMFPWEEMHINDVEKIYEPTNLTQRILLEKPEVVFIDIELYDISGLDVIKECNEKNSNSIFVIISGHDNFNYAHQAANLGVLYYLLKPIDPEDVAIVTARIKKALLAKEQSSLEREPNIDFVLKDELNASSNIWKQINHYIENNYQCKIQVKDICKACFIAQRTFFSIFKNNTNQTFVEYLTTFRIKKAEQLLLLTDDSIPKIAESIGIKDYYYFNKVFKKITGKTPLEYRKQNGGTRNVEKHED